jgi:hypothetical protein
MEGISTLMHGDRRDGFHGRAESIVLWAIKSSRPDLRVLILDLSHGSLDPWWGIVWHFLAIRCGVRRCDWLVKARNVAFHRAYTGLVRTILSSPFLQALF